MEGGPALRTAGHSPHLGDPQHTLVHPPKSTAVRKSHKLSTQFSQNPRLRGPPPLRVSRGTSPWGGGGGPLCASGILDDGADRSRPGCRALMWEPRAPEGTRLLLGRHARGQGGRAALR